MANDRGKPGAMHLGTKHAFSALMRHTPIVALDHITVNVRDLDSARRFYEAALGAIGMKINLDFDSAFGLGSKKEKIFWLSRDRKAEGKGHYAFRVAFPDEVDAFYEAAMKAGGTDNGAPGARPDYGPNYYAAFVRDREGNNIEVVCYTKRGTRPSASRSRSEAASRKRPSTTARQRLGGRKPRRSR